MVKKLTVVLALMGLLLTVQTGSGQATVASDLGAGVPMEQVIANGLAAGLTIEAVIGQAMAAGADPCAIVKGALAQGIDLSRILQPCWPKGWRSPRSPTRPWPPGPSLKTSERPWLPATVPGPKPILMRPRPRRWPRPAPDLPAFREEAAEAATSPVRPVKQFHVP